MKIERVKVADLKPAEKNTRIHNKKQIAEFIRSYEMFGQIRPVIIDENNVIWCGNGFYMAMKEAGVDKVDAYRLVGLTEDKKKKLMLADNQIFTLGGMDVTAVDEILAEIGDFDIPGYDADTLAQLYGDIETAAEEMKSYGVLNDETVDAIEKETSARAEVQETQVYTPSSRPQTEDESLPPYIEASNGMVNVPKDKGTRPFIVCPRCGEKIWL